MCKKFDQKGLGIDEDIINSVKKLNDYKIIVDGKEEKPIVIMPPDGSNQNELRVYAYGGDIGRIPICSSSRYSLARDKEYCKYLKSDGYNNNRKRSSFYPFPKWLNKLPYKKPDDLQDYDEEEILKRLLNSPDKKEELVGNKADYYLPLILAASRSRFTSKNKKDYIKQEKWAQHEIAKRFQQNAGIKNGRPLIITDMEYDIPLSESRSNEKAIRKKGPGKGKASKPDFVMFDGESFGIVEFKYMGDSMKRYGENALDWHYLDFYSAVKTDKETTLNKYKECLERLNTLLNCHIILPDDEKIRNYFIEKCNNGLNWCEQAIMKMSHGESEYVNVGNLFWFGFLFVGGKDDVTKCIGEQLINPCTSQNFRDHERREKEQKVAENVREFISNDSVDVRCQYIDIGDDEDLSKIELDMSKSIKQVYKEMSMKSV